MRGHYVSAHENFRTRPHNLIFRPKMTGYAGNQKFGLITKSTIPCGYVSRIKVNNVIPSCAPADLCFFRR